MSYLSTPRICFSGKFTAAGPTRNNLLWALDNPAILGQNPGWDYKPLANGDFTLNDCRVVSACDATGNLIVDPTADPVIGAEVLGEGKMADLDPEHRRITELVGMFLTISLPRANAGACAPASLSGRLERTPLRDYWNNPALVTVTAWQSVLSESRWSEGVERSGVLKQLRDTSPDGLSVRLTPIAVPNRGVNGILLGVVGPWSAAEPKQFVAARRLITRRPAGQLPFPVASCLVDTGRKKLVADLDNMPMNPGKPPADLLLSGLVACILKTDDEGGGIWTTLGTSRDVTADRWLQTAGIFEWDLTPDQLGLLQGHRLRLTFDLEDEPLVMEEHPSGSYVDIDRRSLRLNPGESADVDVYARQLGQPLVGQVVNFSLWKQKAQAAVETIVQPGDPGYPPDPDLPINSEPWEILLDRPGPLQVVTDQDGFALLTIKVKPGEFLLPESRQTIDSQLYFLGEPDGWQSWGAIGPNNGDLDSHRVGAGCALTVLVYNTHPKIATPRWEDIEPWLRRYAFLYPAMLKEAYLNLSVKDRVDRHAYEIYRRLKCIDFEDVEYMPISRDLSEFRRQTILDYLKTVMTGQPPC